MNKKEVNQRFIHCNFFPKSRRGSHVGVIASFSIFILFLIGIYLVSEPAFKVNKDKKALLEYTKNALIEKFSSHLTIAVIKPGTNCSTLSDSLVGVDNVYALAKDANGNPIGASYSGSNLIVDSGNEPLWIYYSKIPFNNVSGSGSGCPVPPIESIRDSNEIFESKIKDGIENFTSLKDSLNIPPGSQLGLGFQYHNGTVIRTNEINVSEDIYSEEKNIQYIDKNANSLAGKLTIKVW